MTALKVVLASQNPGKVAEFASALPSWEIVPVSTLSQQHVTEPYATFVENALHKARTAADLTNEAVLADDSGLCVPALGGAPGIYSSRYSGLGDEQNNIKLLQEMQQQEDRSAYFYCILVYLRGRDDPTPLIAEGRWWGQIATSPKGSSGFGYDSIFYLPSLDKTAAELTKAQKNQLSHRALALNHLKQSLAAHDYA